MDPGPGQRPTYSSTLDVLDPALIAGRLWTGHSIDEDRPVGRVCAAERVLLDPATGAVVGTEDGFGSTAVASGATVIQRQVGIDPACGVGTSAVVVRDETTRAELWRGTLPGTASAESDIGPTVVGDRIVAVHGDTVSAFPAAGCAAASCSPTWTVTVPFGTIPLGPAVAGPGGRALVIQHDVSTGRTDVVAYAAATGTVDWRAQLGKSLVGGHDVHLAVAGDSVYAVTMSQGFRKLQVFSAAGCGAPTCTPTWSALPLGGDNTGAPAGPVVAGGVVYVSDNHGIHAYPAGGCEAATCTEIATIYLEGMPRHVTVSGGRLYAVTSNSTLLALAPS